MRFCLKGGEKIQEGKMHRTKTILNLGLFLAVAILSLWFLTGCAPGEKPLKYSTIHEAAEKGDLEDVKNHLRRGVAVNAQGPYGVTPLHYAAANGQTKVAEFLIKKGAEVNAVAGDWRAWKEICELWDMGGKKV